jgi:hypothetical protein
MAYVLPNTTTRISVAALAKIAVRSQGAFVVSQEVGFVNQPTAVNVLTSSNGGSYTSGAFSSATTVILESGAYGAFYDVGASAAVTEIIPQGDPNALNATGTLTAAMLLGKIVTSSTAAAVTATLDTGAIMDAATTLAIGEGIVWSAINTGGANAFTVTASSGHTIVGAGAVAASSSGRFLTRKTAASTFVTYRLS